MNEIQAAFGLLQLQHIDAAFEKRRMLDANYRELLHDVPGITTLSVPENTVWNQAYFPVRISKDYPLSRDEIYEVLKSNEIMSRRYFYPLISNFPMYRAIPSAAKSLLPQANIVSDEVLCLPIYPDLEFATQNKIVEMLKSPYLNSAISFEQAS